MPLSGSVLKAGLPFLGSLLFSICLSGSPGWQAGWIWSESDGSMLLARKTFDLQGVPDSARLKITASSLYKLYVNGQYVARGPARCAPHHQSYDVHDLGDLLETGQNTIAVRVHYQAGTIAYHHQGRAGLLAQLELSEAGVNRIIPTNEDWLVLPDPAWDENAPRMSRFHLEVCDRVDLRQNPGGWTGRFYDDSEWQRAKTLMRTVGWPSPQRNALPQALTPPWTFLVERDIPFLQEQLIPATKLIQAQQFRLKGLRFDPSSHEKPALVSGIEFTGEIAEGFTTDSINNRFLLYDLGSSMSGMPYLDIQGPAGTVVDVMCAPYMVDDTFSAHVFDSVLIDRIILTGGRDQWESTYFKPVRYLGLVVRGPAGKVDLHQAGVRRISYPFSQTGSLKTPEEPFFEQLWKASARTIDVCTTDGYTDNYRERRQYVQTGYYAALGNYWVFGDTALQRRYLVQAAREQQANGLMPAYAPRHGDDFMVILDSNTAWIRSLREYFLYSGDEETVRQLLPAARKLMDFLARYSNSDGMLEDPPYAYWLDHAQLDRRGANLCMNGHYHGALADFADILEWLGEPDPEVYSRQAELIRRAVREKFWNAKKGLFCDAVVDGEQSGMFSEHGNAMALAIGAATDQQARKVAGHLLKDDDGNFIKREGGMTMVTPAMSYFLHRGLCDYGYVVESLQLLKKRFSRMLEPETNQTLWEEWWRDGTGRTGVFQKRTRSDAQTESAFPPALLGEYLLGVSPVQPGLRVVNISIPQCGLKEISGRIPSPHGNLELEWDLDAGVLRLNIPDGMAATLTFSNLTTYTSGTHEISIR